MFRAVSLPIIRSSFTYQCQVYSDGQRNCPKYVEVLFFSQNKFGKLVYLLVLL